LPRDTLPDELACESSLNCTYHLEVVGLSRYRSQGSQSSGVFIEDRKICSEGKLLLLLECLKWLGFGRGVEFSVVREGNHYVYEIAPKSVLAVCKICSGTSGTSGQQSAAASAELGALSWTSWPTSFGPVLQDRVVLRQAQGTPTMKTKQDPN